MTILNVKTVEPSFRSNSKFAKLGRAIDPAMISLAGLGFVMPFGQEVKPAFLNDFRLAALFAVLSLATCAYNVAGRKTSYPLPLQIKRAIGFLTIYGVTLTLATITRPNFPQVRLQLFVFFPIALFCFWAMERTKPGSWWTILYWVGVGHILLAVVLNDRTLIASGADRLGGITSPVLLGFESVMIFWMSILRVKILGKSPVFGFIVCTVSLYSLYGAFSRAAIISWSAGLAILWISKSSRYWIPKLIACCTFIYLLTTDLFLVVVQFLGGNDPQSVYTASGRYRIWHTILTENTAFIRGWGFASLYDDNGPDTLLAQAVHGLPAENAAIEALLMAGVFGLLFWLAYVYYIANAIWAIRTSTFGVSLAIGLALLVDATYSIAASGVSFSWWYGLAALSLLSVTKAQMATLVELNEDQPRSLIEYGQSPRSLRVARYSSYGS